MEDIKRGAREAKWARLREAIPEKFRDKIIKELKKLYALYDPRAIDWLASLYDPKTGGFYNSVSAKKTDGYLPDIENTYYCITRTDTLGMADECGGDWTKALPRDIIEKAAEWIISLQDEDGYYYHPQWPKEYIVERKCQSRITRDKGSATEVLRGAGMKPKYTTTPQSGGGSSSSLLTAYESLENFKKHIDGLEEELSSLPEEKQAEKLYVYGHLFQTTVGIMSDEMKRMTIDFFNRHQNTENGTWSEKLSYTATNGVHKIVWFYNVTGTEMKYTENCIKSILEILRVTVANEPSSSICAVVNVWSALEDVLGNVKITARGTEEERRARYEKMRDLIYEGVADAIEVTYLQVKDFLREDGSFSYYRTHSVDNMQGCPCAVPNTKEGDVCGFLMATWDIPKCVFAALDLSEYRIPPFGEEERVRYVEGIRNAK